MPQGVSTARAYFDHIASHADPFAFLAAIPSPPRPDPFFEEEWVDFKGEPSTDKDARKAWSKALSGFANITDGLLIWGIDARKTPPRDIDAAVGLRLIADPHAFESRLRDWVRDATNSPVMGVEYQSHPGSDGKGFVVCLIPESAHRPHRAEFADKHYYYRAGDDFLIAEPGLLRVLFFPQYNYRLKIGLGMSHTVIEAGNYRGMSEITCKMSLYNVGTTSLRDVLIVVNENAGLAGISVHGMGDGWRRVNELFHQPKGLAFTTRQPIHPGFLATFCEARWNTPSRDENGKQVPNVAPFKFTFVLYCEGSLPKKRELTFSPRFFESQGGAFIVDELLDDPGLLNRM